MSSIQKLLGDELSDEMKPNASQPNSDKEFLGNVQRLIGIADSKDFKAADNAILMLGQLPFTEESFQCLYRWTEFAVTGTGPHSREAITALGMMGHPRAIARLVEIVASTSYSCFEASKALGHPRNNAAVESLLHIAFTHLKYVSVEAAVDALELIGTPEAVSALEEFYSQPARILVVRYSGAEDASLKSSSDLGQVPVDEDPVKDLARLVSENPFWYGTHEQMLEGLKIFCSTYGLVQSELNKLKEFIDGTTPVYLDTSLKGKFQHHVSLYKRTSHGSQRITVLASLAPLLEERLGEADQRKQEIFKYLLEGDTTQLEKTLMQKLTMEDPYWACDFFCLLPRIKRVPQLMNLVHSGGIDKKIQVYLSTKLLQQRTPEQEEARKAAGEVLAEFEERKQARRQADEKERIYQASRDVVGATHMKAADAALLAGQDMEALADFRLACESGGVNTYEHLSARRVELEKRFGIKPASELMVLCLTPLLEHYRKQGSHQAQSCESRLKDARRKAAGK